MTSNVQRWSHGRSAAVSALLVVALARPADVRAQNVTVPSFSVATAGLSVDVAATFAGTYFVYGTQGATLHLQRIAPTGVWDDRVIIEKPSRAVRPAIAPLRGGGFTAAWRDNSVTYGRFLDVLGVPSSSTLQWSDALVNGIVRVASVTSVPGAIVGPSQPDLCSDEIAITVPLRGVPGSYKANRLKLQSRADDYDARRDKDKLALECLPEN